MQPSAPHPAMNLARFWRLNLAVWIFFGVFDFGLRYLTYDDVQKALIFTAFQEPFAFLLSGFLYLIYRRPRLSGSFGVQTATWIVTLSFLAATTHTAAAALATDTFNLHTPGWTAREEWCLRLIFFWMVYIAWSLTFYTIQSRHEAEDRGALAERALQEAQRMELELLRSQLDPHFLFNSLNSVAAEIPPHPDRALEMVHQLSDYLRYSLDHRHQVLAPLDAELKALEAYLSIEKARFGERLLVRMEADPEARSRTVPSFLLQPLVENAMKYASDPARRELQLQASSQENLLRITVSNRGRLRENLVEGVGLETLRRRLALHYPERATFHLSEKDGVVTADLLLKGEPCSV